MKLSCQIPFAGHPSSEEIHGEKERKKRPTAVSRASWEGCYYFISVFLTMCVRACVCVEGEGGLIAENVWIDLINHFFVFAFKHSFNNFFLITKVMHILYETFGKQNNTEKSPLCLSTIWKQPLLTIWYQPLHP